MGPSLLLAKGAYGCAVLTCGEQNPIVYIDYDLQACGDSFSAFADKEYREPLGRGEMRRRLLDIRDEFKRQLAPLRKQMSMKGRFTDAEMKTEIDGLVRRLHEQANPPSAT